MAKLARLLNSLSRGRLHPNHVTALGLLMHLPTAWLIAVGQGPRAAIFLVVFGLLDALDGELARLQNRASSAGMVLDATTDRIKEVILYAGIAWGLITAVSQKIVNFVPMVDDMRWTMTLVILALGGSLLVSYVKAKGETAVKDAQLSPNQINRLFQDGLARYEVRMAVLAVGLATGTLVLALVVLVVLTWLTAFSRLINVYRRLDAKN